MTVTLISKLAALRRKQGMVSTGLGIAIGVALAVGVLALEMVIDDHVEWPWSDRAGLPWMVRAIVLGLLLAGLVWICLSYILAPLVFGEDHESLALAVEREEPAFAGRLIASVQLARAGAVPAGASNALVAALVRETEVMSADKDFSRIVATDPLARWSLTSLCLLVLAGVLFLVESPASGVLLRRALLSNDPVPRKTRVIDVTGDLKVPRGENVTLSASADGVQPSAGAVELTYANGTKQTLAMNAAKSTGHYACTIEGVQDAFTYVVRLNDGRSDPFKIQPVARPAVADAQCTQIYPAYTHHANQRRLPGDLSLLAGSRLVLRVTSSKPLKANASQGGAWNHVHLAGVEKDFPLIVDPTNPAKATTADVNQKPGLPPPAGTTGLSIHLLDTDGIENKEPAVYRVDLLPDNPPTIRISSNNPKEETVTPIADETLGYEATDDYGLAKIELKYKIDGGDVRSMDLPLQGTPTTASSGSAPESQFHWLMREVAPAPGKLSLLGSSIEFWLAATDTNNVTGPGVGESDHYTLKVISEDDKRAELRAATGDVNARLDPLTKDQQDAASDLGKAIIHGSGESPATQP